MTEIEMQAKDVADRISGFVTGIDDGEIDIDEFITHDCAGNPMVNSELGVASNYLEDLLTRIGKRIEEIESEWTLDPEDEL